MKKLFLGFCLIAFGLYAEETNSGELFVSSEGEFHIDKDLVNKLYEDTIHAKHIETNVVSGFLTVRPQFSVFLPSKFTLSNQYHFVHYSEKLWWIRLIIPGFSAY